MKNDEGLLLHNSLFIIPCSIFFRRCYFFSYIGLMEPSSELTVALKMLNRVPGVQECDATGVK